MDLFKKIVRYKALREYYENNIEALQDSIDICKEKIKAYTSKIQAEQIELKGKKLTLTKNIVLCGQDFKFFRGIPEAIEFTIKDINDANITLIAPKHGEIGDYGNGSISASFKDLHLYFESKKKREVRDAKS